MKTEACKIPFHRKTYVFNSLLFFLIIINSCSNSVVLVCGAGIDDYSLSININEIKFSVLSDSIIIRGEILDSLTFESLIGANIEIQFEDLKELPRTYTDINGNFVLSFKYDPNYLIKFSYVGYRSQPYNLKKFLQQYFEH
jgi:hypothetical protein